MVYGKYRRSRYHKRSFKRRGLNTFSRYKTYKNRSSKAQAYQIYKLNRKVNTIQKRTKPEIKIDDSGSFSNSGIFALFSKSMVPIIAPVGGHGYSGRLVRLQNVTVWGSVQYTGNDSFTQPINVRFIFYQCKGKGIYYNRSNNYFYNFDMFLPAGSTEAGYYRGPLNPGITSNVKIVADKKVSITDKDILRKTFRWSFSNLYYIRTDKNIEDIVESDDTFYHGYMGCFIIGVNNDAQPEGSKDYQIQMNWRVAYYDE